MPKKAKFISTPQFGVEFKIPNFNKTSYPSVVVFSEDSDKESSEIYFKRNNLVSLSFQKEKLLLELEQKQSQEEEEAKEAIEKVLKEKSCLSSYSLSFLALVKSFGNTLDLQDKISFCLKMDCPLKIAICFKKLTNTELTYYLAPRVPEADNEEEDLDAMELEFVQDKDQT